MNSDKLNNLLKNSASDEDTKELSYYLNIIRASLIR